MNVCIHAYKFYVATINKKEGHEFEKKQGGGVWNFSRRKGKKETM